MPSPTLPIPSHKTLRRQRQEEDLRFLRSRKEASPEMEAILRVLDYLLEEAKGALLEAPTPAMARLQGTGFAYSHLIKSITHVSVPIQTKTPLNPTSVE